MSNCTVTRMACARIPTEYGDFQLCYYSNTCDNKEHLAFYMGQPEGAENVLVRVHSECFTGDVLSSLRCDCGEQLNRSLALVASKGQGVVVYLRQEGRGIGLLEKLRAYNLQDQGYDTVDANLMLGHQADERDYTIAARIIEELGIKSVQLITNNPLKITALQAEGVNVTARVAVDIAVHAENEHYMLTKARRMDHLLPGTAFTTTPVSTAPVSTAPGSSTPDVNAPADITPTNSTPVHTVASDAHEPQSTN